MGTRTPAHRHISLNVHQNNYNRIVMEKEMYTRITLEQSMKKASWEIPFEDISASDILDAFSTIALCLRFGPSDIIEAAIHFINVNSEEWEIAKDGFIQ